MKVREGLRGCDDVIASLSAALLPDSKLSFVQSLAQALTLSATLLHFTRWLFMASATPKILVLTPARVYALQNAQLVLLHCTFCEEAP